MKWLEITEETFLSNSAHADVMQKDGRCFGRDIEGRFYLYVDNGDKYVLDIYDKTYEQILWDTDFHVRITKFFIDRKDFEMLEDVAHWINATLDLKTPFMLEDIHYCDYDG